MKRWVMLAGLLGIAGTATGGETWVQETLAGYQAIETASCEVRRLTVAPDRRVRTLSRVHWAKGDRIHVDSVVPLPRRHVADGERMYYYVEGDPKGFSRAIGELDAEWLHSLRRIPGTPMDHLVKLQEAEETVLPPTAEFPVRRGYAAGPHYVVLSADGENRLQRLEYFTSPAMEKRTSLLRLDRQEEVLPGVWIPLRHRLTAEFDGEEVTETVQILNVQVNEPLAATLFDKDLYFKDVEFVDNFEEIYR